MTLDAEIVVVSGLPRCGTSLMMQMLDRGGMPVLTDRIRAADTDNPRGYYEFERVKKTREDPSWVPEARGRVVKMVSSLLYDLPGNETYRIVFMRRDVEEMLDSQEKMLKRLDKPTAPRDRMADSFGVHLSRLFDWLPTRPNMRLLEVSYNSLLLEAASEARRVQEFLDGRPDLDRMLGAIDSSLYRNRNGT